MKLNFISVTAKDLERAKEFYEKLLEKEPDEETERLVTFEFKGIDFGIHYPPADGVSLEEFDFGNNTVPAFEVENLDDELERIEDFAEIENVREAADHRWAIIKDTEGNRIEIYSLS